MGLFLPFFSHTPSLLTENQPPRMRQNNDRFNRPPRDGPIKDGPVGDGSVRDSGPAR